MPALISNSQKSLLGPRVFRFAQLWEIARRDGVVLRFTDHWEPIRWGFETFEPADFEATASEGQAGFTENNVQIAGAVASDKITYEDLRAGLYSDARVTVRVVDWRYPFAEIGGAFRTDVFLVDGVRFSGEVFTADILSLPGVLVRKVGRSLNRDCDAEVGDSRCGLDLELYRVSGEILSVVETRRKFTTDLTAPDGRFDLGRLTFTTGASAGFSLDVKTYLNASGAVELQIRSPLAVAAGDEFTIVPGCGQTREDCKGTGGTKNRPWPTNIVNFRGFPDMPGSTVLLKTP